LYLGYLFTPQFCFFTSLR